MFAPSKPVVGPQGLIGRRELIIGAGLLAAGCSKSGGGGVAEGDMMLGQESAPVTIIEYASVTCPHCREFHTDVWPRLRANYIETGKVKFVFREFPTPPEQVAVAGFQLARCGGASSQQYFERIDALFDQQRAIYATFQTPGALRDKLVEIGAAAGLSRQQVLDCISDPAGAERVRATVADGSKQFNITGTPTIIVNGKKLEDVNIYSYDVVAPIIDAALGGGEPAAK